MQLWEAEVAGPTIYQLDSCIPLRYALLMSFPVIRRSLSPVRCLGL
jgi:hypothetical protein